MVPFNSFTHTICIFLSIYKCHNTNRNMTSSILSFMILPACSYEDKRSRVAFVLGGWILLVCLVLDFRTISKVLFEVDLFTDFIVSLFLWNIELWLHYRVAALCRLACIRLFNFLTDMLTAVCTVIYRAPFFAIIISCPSLNCDCKPSHAQTHTHTHTQESGSVLLLNVCLNQHCHWTG